MRIEIVTKNYNAGDKIKGVIEKKLEKFSRYFDDNALAKVVLKEIHDNKHVMEITIHFENRIIRSEVVSDNMYGNIDVVLPKLEGQIRKYRTRIGKQVKITEDNIYDENADTEVIAEPSIKRVKPTALITLTADEAISEMEILDHDFYVFINAKSGSVNVVYRRADANYGLLDLIY